METAVMAPSPANEFNFDSSSSCTTPYMSAPSSPPRVGAHTPFFSAPSSPTRISFSPETHENGAADFAFDFSGHLDKHLYLPADELFDGGKIKALKPPPWSPKKAWRELDYPFASEAFKNTQSRLEQSQMVGNLERGRERGNITTTTTPSSSRHNKTRSLSPFRVSDLLFDQETEQEQKTDKTSTSSSSSSSSSWYKKWKIKDLLLFRSASEGRQTSKAQLNKYTVLKKNNNNNNSNNISEEDEDDSKNMSFRSNDSSSVLSSRRRSRGISAHELHYTINRAVSEEMKRKTFLPYKQGLLGCLGFQPNISNTRR